MVTTKDVLDKLITIDPKADEIELVKKFEKDTGKTLYPAQSERLMISIISYVSNLNLVRIKNALKNFFVQTASLFFLKLWGELINCPQLEAKQAKDILFVELYEAYSVDKILPKGAKVETKDGEYIFTTDEDLIIKAGELTGTVGITSEFAGSILNEYKAGEINNLIENYDYIKSVKNLNGASGGDDEEDVERYRKRLLTAFEQFSVAGPKNAYKFLALSANQSITDVEVTSPSSGVVAIYVLTKNGTADENIINEVKNVVSADDKRPLTDNVKVYSAESIEFEYSASLILTTDADYDTTVELVKAGLAEYFAEVKKELNKEIVPSDSIAKIKAISGVYDFMPDTLEIQKGYINKFYDINLKTLDITRKEG